ncbi:MAG: DUF3570 domain-containing protein [Proteobacteria bacterium]|nr:DUF3570 domain-containing protein [Pseudomonadota bacterium]
MVLLLSSVTAAAQADQGTGSWSGYLEPRARYYWDRSTRVVVPTLYGHVQTPGGLEFGATGLVDVITSASISAGLLVDRRFTEWRKEGGLYVGYEADLGEAQLKTTVSGRISQEPDYVSRSAGAAVQLSLNERNSVLHLALTVLPQDEVGRVLRGFNVVSEQQRRILRGASTLLGWDQVVSPTMVASFSYTFGYLTGFLANRYRSVRTNDSPPVPEQHPGRRLRHNLQARLAWYHPDTQIAVHAMYRAYLDSWKLAALTPELRVFKEVGDDLVLRWRYRYYRQSGAIFFKENQPYSQQIDIYFSADPKMGAFSSHEAGAQIRMRLFFLEDSLFGFASRAWADLSFDYAWRTYTVTRFDPRYGKAMIGMAGLRLPF